MDMEWAIFISILIINSIAALAIAIVLTRRPHRPGLNSLIYMLIGLSIWSFAYAMITISPSLEAKHFWLKLENIGILSVPNLWFFFTIKYTRLDKWATGKPVVFLFWVIPMISLVFLFSERWFHLYYSSTMAALGWGGPLIITRGPMYWVTLVQTYSLNLIAMGILTWRFIESRHVYRSHLLFLVGAVLFPFTINMVYQLVPDLIPFFSVPIDLTPLAFTITAILLAAGIFGLRLFDLAPIARDTIMEHIPEMVFVTDSFDRIIDANVTARKWLGKPLDEIAGRDAIDVFKQWPQLLNRFFLTEYSKEEIEISGSSKRTLELVITPIYDRIGALEGRVIVAHDVTERKLLENKLQEANDLLKHQLADIDALTIKLQEQAIRDPLTGAFNRRFFAESLDREMARAVREQVALSVIIMDVDHFKQFNDTYGHKCGDLVLESLARFLHNNTRRGDIVCRYGGEEFVILMPDAPLESAYERAELLRSTFEEVVVEYDGKKMGCTLSMGVASYPVHASSSDALLIVADHALYQSKSNGRNRVTVYKP